MNETNPSAGVESPSIEDRMSNFIAQSEADQSQEAPPTETQAEEVEQPEGQASPEETESPASETEAAVEQPVVDAFEIVHDGKQVKLTREEAIKYAMQGFDYTQKTQVVAEQRRVAEQTLQRLAQGEQMVPPITAQLAEVKALEAQLAPYSNLDWVALATQQGAEAYAQHQANYQNLLRSYQGATGKFQQAYGSVTQQMQQLRQQKLQAEDANLGNVIPEWKDPAKKEAGKAAVLGWLQAQGIPPHVADAKLDDAMSIAIVHKAMLYDQLQKSKTDKTKTLRSAPPVTVPGAAQSSTAKADKEKQLHQRLKKSGTREDAMAVLLNRL